jgi:hypothetical protein
MIHNLLSKIVAGIMLFCALPVFSQLQEPNQPVNLIIDSDMAIDTDDV